ncbi:MAG TPA: SRPBCC family protein [Acidimicrobiales bacterium]
MTERTVTCNTFTIERTLAASPERVFEAFANAKQKAQWLAPLDGEAPGDVFVHAEFDFKVGGHEQFTFVEEDGRKMRYNATFYDIVPTQRIVYSYEMYSNESRISISVASIQFLKTADATTLVWTEQGAFLDGLDTSELREGGTSWLLDNVAEYLDARSSSDSR